MTPSPPAAAVDDAVLADVCSALHLQSTAHQRQQLIRYVDVLMQWNAVHNLTAVRGRADILLNHLADCLATIDPIHHRLADAPPRIGRRARVLDVGSGGGLPGLVIATMLPNVDVTCVDAVGKKTAFIRQAALEAQLRNVDALHARVEQHGEAVYDLITSRAFSTLTRFVALSAHLLAPGGWWMAMKARRPDDELAALQRDHATTFHVEQLMVPGLDAARCLVWIQRRTHTL